MAFSSSVPLPLICPKGKLGSSSSSNNYFMLGKWRCCASLFNRRALRATARATTAISAVPKQESSPWLMLPPESEGGNYQFYSLADDKVETLCPSDEIVELGVTCCRGSSHGWLGLLGYDTFILYNPISLRHIKLPSVVNLPRSPNGNYMNANFSDIGKMILTCSPDEDEENCRVLIISLYGYALALCCPGRSKEWTSMLDENRDPAKRRFCEDCVYSAQLKLLFVHTCDGKVETWDLADDRLSSPKLIKVDKCYFTTPLRWLWCSSSLKVSLVVAGEDLLYVIQYIMDNVGPDGSYLSPDKRLLPDKRRLSMTIHFDILKYDRKKGVFKYMSNLGGLAIFVGILSHAVAIPATRFPELKPDSIYFTDGHSTGAFDGDDSYKKESYGHDIGIYNYQDKTVSPCYYPCDIPSLKEKDIRTQCNIIICIKMHIIQNYKHRLQSQVTKEVLTIAVKK